VIGSWQLTKPLGSSIPHSRVARPTTSSATTMPTSREEKEADVWLLVSAATTEGAEVEGAAIAAGVDANPPVAFRCLISGRPK
jgi:hypothetical protein